MLKLRFKDNKHNAVWLVEPKVTVGRLSSNDLVVDDPGVANHHLEVVVEHEQLTLVNSAPDKPVYVNGELVTAPHKLSINDTITLGYSELVVVDPKTDVGAAVGQATRVRGGSTLWALKANHTSLSNRVFPVKESTVVGRSSDCDISLGAAHLSRRHAELQVREGLLYIKDLGSSNGTFLNGNKVSEARVKRGDELRFDTLSFGVIGPADELDKTTVRTRGAVSPKPAAARPAAAGGRPRPAAARPAASRPAPAAREVVHAQHSASASSTPGQGKGWWLMLGIVCVLILAVVFGLQLV
jgi:pSer/pThr/pTyr-binding forkhead associated (FHA) protein